MPALTLERAVFCNNWSRTISIVLTRATHPASSSIDPSLSGIVNDNPGVDSISLEYTRNVEEQGYHAIQMTQMKESSSHLYIENK